jgi:hypothetical protein
MEKAHGKGWNRVVQQIEWRVSQLYALEVRLWETSIQY